MYLTFIGPRHLIYHPPPQRDLNGDAPVQTCKSFEKYERTDRQGQSRLQHSWLNPRQKFGTTPVRQADETNKKHGAKVCSVAPKAFWEKLCIRFSLLKVPFTITRKIDANKASYWRPIVSLQWDVINKSDVKCIPLCGELHQSLTHVNDEQ